MSRGIKELVRDAPAGQVIRWLTRNKYLQYPEEKPDFRLPDCWTETMNGQSGSGPSNTTTTGNRSSSSSSSSSSFTAAPDAEKPRPSSDTPPSTDQDQEKAVAPRDEHSSQENLHAATNEDVGLTRTKSIPIAPRLTKDGAILVDWYYNDDDQNPHNWSNRRRLAVASIICAYTFVVYTTSAIYTSSTEGVMDAFDVSAVKATLGLSLYVLGYGVGPLLFSPLGEIPLIGRSPVYAATMTLFVILSIPTAFAQNYAGLMVLRFLTGFFGSPCLASGGASLSDIYSLMALPYAMMAWVAAAYCGPALGPLLSGFAVPVMGWRWSLFESIWAAAPVWILMLVLLPETSSPNILLRRAKRLRKLTGDSRLMSQSEIDQRDMKFGHVLVDAMIKPLEITMKDPAVLFVQVYTAIIYGIYYSFFEVFPLVYPPFYGFNLGEIGVVFLCILVSCIIGVAIYSSYLYYYINPRIMRLGMPPQETRLVPALPASIGPTIGLFLFAWTARASIHWIVPTIGITIYGASVFIVMQCIFVYIPLSYPKYAASLFAANDFFRSAFAAGSVIFAHPLYANLGVAKGTSLLGGLSVLGIVGIWLLYFYGHRLRALSKFAVSSESY